MKYLYAAGEQNSIDILQKELIKLFDDEVAPGDISLVSAKTYQQSIASKLESRFKKKIIELTALNAREYPFHNMSFSTVHNFKGLENRFIFLVDFSEKNFEPMDMAALYVAMTRPRAGLIIILPAQLKPLVNKILINNLSIIEPRT